MFFRVILQCHKSGRALPIQGGYRSPWKLSEDQWHTGQVLLAPDRKISPGDEGIALIWPLQSEYWKFINVGDSISCYEGRKKSATAFVLEVFDTAMPG